MQVKRIEYIDAVKGLAILLVVLGHCIQKQFAEGVQVESYPHYTRYVYNFIYQFHMPLFMFLSGLFAYKPIEWHTTSNVLQVIRKRFMLLMVPFFVTGLLLTMIRGNNLYWFLIDLFYFSVANYVAGWGLNMLRVRCYWVMALVFVLLSVAIYHNFVWLLQHYSAPYFYSLQFMFYPYYCLGTLCTAYSLTDRMTSSRRLFLVALAVWIGLSVWYQMDGHEANLTFYGYLPNIILPSAAIVSIMYLCRSWSKVGDKAYGVCRYLGLYTLEIYLLHALLPWSYDLTSLLVQWCDAPLMHIVAIVIQLVVASLLTVVITLMSLGVMHVIGRVPYLSQIMLGRKQIIN